MNRLFYGIEMLYIGRITNIREYKGYAITGIGIKRFTIISLY